MSTLLFRHQSNKNVPKIFYESVRWAIRGYWPEPVTQQTLAKFLEDINYFEEPKKYINIGLDAEALATKKNASQNKQGEFESKPQTSNTGSLLPDVASLEKIDELMSKLSIDLDPPPLNHDDARVGGKDLGVLAVYAGIYRDLFGNYEPSREHIKFTPEQAERLDRLVPYHWLTDQPWARVEHFPKEPEPTRYFEPIIDISARFVNRPNGTSSVDGEIVGNSVYHGNIIAACDAFGKPSITLDGRMLNPDVINPKSESQFNNWAPGHVELVNYPKSNPYYYTVVLLNLDSLHAKSSTVHWILSNIKQSSDGAVTYDEICNYLPVFGIRGFGYSRYVFLVSQHDKPIDLESNQISGSTLDSRKFDAMKFLDSNQAAGMKPVGVSWFQTTWDISSNRIFHDHLQMKAPTYDHVQAKNEHDKSTLYPGKIPFNVFLEGRQSKKTVNEHVLLERLKNIDSLDYKDQYVPPRVPPTVFQETDQPSWMHSATMKKKNRLGRWRGLRPASALLPLDNNADLDYPIRPLESSSKMPAEFPNKYRLIPRRQLLKDMPVSLPPNEHQAYFVQEDHEVHLDKVMKVVEEFKKSDKPKEKKK